MATKDLTQFSYKNFNMGIELDIAGAFIYDGISSLKNMKGFNVESEIFSFLYHISVGIERIQKVVIVLLEEVDDRESFEKSLITHNHQELHDRIRNKKNINFNARQNEFLQILSQFYKGGRYNNFIISSNLKRDVERINQYFQKNITMKASPGYFGEILDIQKELLGRVIGSITKKYYRIIEEVCSKENIYTYELRYDSKASKIFLPEYKKDSLHEINVNEVVAIKELIVFLLNTESSNKFMEFLKGIEPLNIEIALLNDYLSKLSHGEASQELVDEVESLYAEEENVKERIEYINCIGNPYILFEEYEDDYEDS